MTRDDLIRGLSNRAQNLLREGSGMAGQLEHSMYVDAYMMLENDAEIIKNLREELKTKTASSVLLQFTARVQAALLRWEAAKIDLGEAEKEIAELYEIAAVARNER